MNSRRRFILESAGICTGLSLHLKVTAAAASVDTSVPVVVSTWNHGMAANEAAWRILINGGYALDAVEAGVRMTEADPDIISVGYGGLPDREGKVTLDASVMNENGDAGSVAFLEHIMHPVSVARLVMEKTPHVMLTGRGALRFAVENGFRKENLLTPAAKKCWKEWKNKDGIFKPVIHIEKELIRNHDTIGMLAVDSTGRLCGACTTSGMAFKLSGRVGDSPIIGAGLFVDGETGGAVATGTGELVMKTLGTFLVVELMRNGLSPADACKEAINRVIKKNPGYRNHQVGFLAVSKDGKVGAFSLQPGFEYAIHTRERNELQMAKSWL